MDFSYELPSFFFAHCVLLRAQSPRYIKLKRAFFYGFFLVYILSFDYGLLRGREPFFKKWLRVHLRFCLRALGRLFRSTLCITFHRQILSISHKDRLSSRHQLIIRKAFFGRGKRNDIFNTSLGLYRPTGKLLAIHTLTIVDSKISPGKEKVFFTFL